MKFKTVLESRVPKKTPQNKWIFSLMLVIEIILNTFMPFFFGFYFAMTQRLIFLVGFIFLVMFNVRFEYSDNDIKIKIIRGI